MLSLIPTVLAAATEPITFKPLGFENLQNLTFNNLISGLLSLAIIIAAIIFFFMLVVGGIRWIVSGGDKQQTEAARNQITAALVGLVIVFAAWAIAQLIGTFFNIDIFNLQVKPIQGL